VEHEFTVRNTTDRAVRILGVDKACNCTTAEVSRRFLEPGQSARLRVSVRVPAARTRLSVSCAVRTDHPTLRDWNYTVAFEYLPRIALSETFLTVGSSDKGVFLRKSKQVMVEVFGRSDEDVPRVRADAPEDLVVENDGLPEHRRLSAGTWTARYPVVVRLSDTHERTPGLHARTVTISSSDGRSASLSASWSYEPPIAVTPSFVHFGQVAAGCRSACRRLSLLSTSGRRFRVLEVRCGDPFARCDAVRGRGSAVSHGVEVAVVPAPEARAGPMTGKIHLLTDEPQQAIVEVRWSMLVLPNGNAGSNAASDSGPLELTGGAR
jgi:hypothetical protein